MWRCPLSSKVTVKMDGILPEWKRKFEARAVAVTEQVLADSNSYIPVDTGELRSSGRKQTRPGEYTVEWGGGDVDYASAVYYGTGPVRTAQNKKASRQWFEKAKAAKLSLWLKMARDV